MKARSHTHTHALCGHGQIKILYLLRIHRMSVALLSTLFEVYSYVSFNHITLLKVRLRSASHTHQMSKMECTLLGAQLTQSEYPCITKSRNIGCINLPKPVKGIHNINVCVCVCSCCCQLHIISMFIIWVYCICLLNDCCFDFIVVSTKFRSGRPMICFQVHAFIALKDNFLIFCGGVIAPYDNRTRWIVIINKICLNGIPIFQ